MQHIPEGNFIIYEAEQREGKTLTGTIFSHMAYLERRRVFSTIQFSFPHEKLDFRQFVLEDGPSIFRNGHIFIDEFNFFFDCRESSTRKNRKFSAFLLQQKKQGCNLTGTTHDINSLDLRAKNRYDYLVKCSVFPKYPQTPKVLKLEIESGPTRGYKKRKPKYIDCRPYLGMYDSFAVYNPFEEDDLPKPRKIDIPRPPVREQPRVAL